MTTHRNNEDATPRPAFVSLTIEERDRYRAALERIASGEMSNTPTALHGRPIDYEIRPDYPAFARSVLDKEARGV